MRRLLMTAVLTLSATPSFSAERDFLTQNDKRLHMTGSAIMVQMCKGAGMSEFESIAFSLGVGLLKEIADHSVRNQGHEHMMDFKADVIGTFSHLLYISVDF